MNIEVQNLSVSLSGKTIISNISLEAKSNQMTAIIGPNGCGKSTLLKTIYRYIRNYQGNIYIDGKNIENYKQRDVAKLISVLTQFRTNDFDFKVEQVVELGRMVHQSLMQRNSREDDDIITEALESVGLLNMRDCYLSKLSGGERQRVDLARAIAQKGKCMILDEPGNHLDIKHQISLMRTIKKMGMTVLAALHDIELAVTYFDYIYVLKDGEIYCHGTPDQIINERTIKEVYEVDSSILYNKNTQHINISYYR